MHRWLLDHKSDTQLPEDLHRNHLQITFDILNFNLTSIFRSKLNHLVQVRSEKIALSYREALVELTQSELLDAVYPKPVIALGEVLHPLMQ